LSSSKDRIERRRKPRLYEPFPAKVRGEDADGVSFELDTVLDNVGPGGLYLRLARNVSQGATLFIVVRLSPAPGKTVFAPTMAFRGIVERVEPGPDGRCGLAVSLTHDPLLMTILRGSPW
jgi:hypothetical protein